MRLPLRARDGSVRAYAEVDEEDFEAVSRWRWSLSSNGYAVRGTERGGVKRAVLLHRHLFGLDHGDGRVVDHISGDKLDNRRANLRLGTQQLNGLNFAGGRGTSRHVGVAWDKARGKWVAYAQIEGRRRHLGRFDGEDEAAAVAQRARDEAIEELTVCR